MAEWRELAEAELGTLQHVATAGTAAVLRNLRTARAKLARWITLAHWACAGVAVAAAQIPPDQPRPGICPTEVVEDARRALAQAVEVHARAGNVFALCRPRLRLVQGGDPLWPVWERHRAEALQHAAWARQALRSAAAHGRAAIEASIMATPFPLGSPGWYAWSWAVLDLAGRAFLAVDAAAAAARLMCHAVAWEYLYVFKILNRREVQRRCLIQALRADASASRR